MQNKMISRLYRYLVKVLGFKGDIRVTNGRVWLTFEGGKLDVGPLAIGEESLAARAVSELPIQWTDELDD